MNLFTLGFKNDKDLADYLNSGTIEGSIIQEPSQKNEDPEQNSETENQTN